MRFSRNAQRGALVLLAILASAPALGGTWVYDDWATATHPSQDDWDDLLAVFARDSSAYMFKQSEVSPLGVTYRPLSMASLIVVQAALRDAPWAHHLVSLALHLACVLGLYAVARRVDPEPDAARPFLVAGLFALHPLGIEAYGWINGRSDVLACAFLAGVAAAICGRAEAPDRRQAVLAGAAGMGAALAKEPAVLCVMGVGVAALLPARGLPDRARLRAFLPALLALCVGLACALALRAMATHGRVSGSLALAADPELGPSYLRVIALAIEQLLLPLPRIMLCLSHELAQPLRGAHVALLLALAALLVALVLGRRFRQLTLIATVLASLLPIVPVKQLVWLGFDRYLYMPLFLLCLAVSEPPARPLSVPAARFARGAALFTLALFGLASFTSARSYQSQNAWLGALIAARPDDASGYILSVKWFMHHQDTARARLAVARAPRNNLSPALAHELGGQLLKLGFPGEAIALSEQTYQRHPRSAVARFDAMQARAAVGRFAEAFELALACAEDPQFCPAVRRWLAGYRSQPSLPAEQRPALERTLARIDCPR